jgi:hypothetical protein
MIDEESEKKEVTPEIFVESDDDDDKEEEEKEEEEEEEFSWDVLEKSEASGEDENERTMREERSDREAVVMEKKRVSLSPPASLDVGGDAGKKSSEDNEGKGEEEEEEEENSSEKTTRKGEEGTEEDSDEFSDLGEESRSSEGEQEEEEAAEEEKKTALDSLKTEVRAFFHNARKNASRAPTMVTNAWRRLARDARRRFRDLLKRAKAFKDGLSEDDKNLLKAAGVLVGAIVAVNVSKAIIGGRSSAPFT